MSFLSVGSFALFIVILSVLVFVHEIGHYLAARRFKVHIEEFGFGYPPRVLGVVRDAEGKRRWFFGRNAPPPAELGGPRTIYSLNAIPLGGFVRPRGEDDPSAPGGLAAAPRLHRVVILAAGAAFNLVFAFVVFVAGFRLGWPDRVFIAGVEPGSPAEAAGVQPNDAVLRINGTDIHYREQMAEITYRSLGQPVEMVLLRGETTIQVSLTPRRAPPEGQGPMGVQMGQAMVTNYTWPQAIGRAGQEMYFQFNYLIHLPGQLLRREISLEDARPCGPKCLSDLTTAAVTTAREVDAVYPVISLIGLISVALAFTNLLPLPALDGGRILFVLIEAVRGRRVNPAREGMVHFVGMVLLLALMAVITYYDFAKPIIVPK